LLHQNNIGVTYVKTLNFRMELVRFMPLYFMAMPRSIIIVLEAPFILAFVHIVDGVKSRPQTPRGTKFVTLHENIPREVNKFFVNQPLDLGRGGSYPLGPPKPQGPLRHFGLQTMNRSRPPLPPNRPYR
jgi:hypothetical protein